MVRSTRQNFIFRAIPLVGILLAVVTASHPNLLFGDRLETAEVRRWLAYDETLSYSATLETANATMVRLRSSETGAIINLEYDKLADYDKRVIKVRSWYEEELDQYRLNSAYVADISLGTRASTERLIASHHAGSVAPYAGLWGAVSLTLATNDFRQATTVLQQVVKRIDEQRNLDRHRHRRTLASALNNLAICFLKAREPSHAATNFIRIFEEKLPFDPTIEHNILQFVNLASIKGSPFEVGDAMRRRFVSSFPKDLIPKQVEDKGWFYVLDADLPSDRVVDFSFSAATPPQPNFINVWAATGVALNEENIIIPKVGWLKTNAEETIQFTAVLPFEGARDPAQYDLSRKIENDDSVLLEIVTKQTNSAEQAIRLQGIWPTLDSQISDETKFATFRLACTSDAVSRSLEVVRGKPVLIDDRGSPRAELNSETSWAWQRSFGLPGGCVCDDRGNFIGIARFNESVREVYDQGTVLLGDTLKQSLATLEPNSTSKPSISLTGPSVAEKISKAKAACVLVLAWKYDKEAAENTISGTGGNPSDLRIQDPWCVQCEGRGMFDCPNKGCHKGVESYKDRVQVGFNPNTRQPVFGDKIFTRECRTCNGAGLRKCPFCRNGKLQ